MPPRAIWRGQLRVSLVTIPVRLFTATETGQRISLHRLHRDCGQRVRNQLRCPKHGDLEQADVIKGYEYEKDRYIALEDEELDRIKLKTEKVIDIQQFAAADELDQRYIDRPYYLGPDGPVAERAYVMIREAMAEAGVLAIGQVALFGREQVVAIRPDGKGFVAMTLRLTEEVRSGEPYFEEIDEDAQQIDKKQMKLAQQLIENMVGPLELANYKDHYQQKLQELIQAKLEGEEAVVYEEEEAPAPLDIMEALRQSVERAGGGSGGKATGGRRRRRGKAA